MKGYGYHVQKEAMDCSNLRSDYLDALEEWLMDGVNDMMLLCRDMAMPENANGLDHFIAATAVTLQHALKSMSDGIVRDQIGASLKRDVLQQVRVAMMQLHMEPDLIIRLANEEQNSSYEEWGA